MRVYPLGVLAAIVVAAVGFCAGVFWTSKKKGDDTRVRKVIVYEETMVRVPQAEYDELKRAKADLEQMRELMQQWRQNGKLPRWPGVVDVQVVDMMQSDDGHVLAVALRDALAVSGRYALSDTVTPRIVISLMGVTVCGDTAVEVAAVIYGCDNGYTSRPQMIMMDMRRWPPKGFSANKVAAEIIGRLDDVVADMRR